MKYLKKYNEIKEEQIDESVLTVAGGILLAYVSWKVIKWIFKKVVGHIGQNIKLEPEKLFEIIKQIKIEALENGASGRDMLIITHFFKEMKVKIENGEIETIKQIMTELGKLDDE